MRKHEKKVIYLFAIFMIIGIIFSSNQKEAQAFLVEEGFAYTKIVERGGYEDRQDSIKITEIDGSSIYGTRAVKRQGEAVYYYYNEWCGDISTQSQMDSYKSVLTHTIETRTYGGRSCSCIVIEDEYLEHDLIVIDQATGVWVEEEDSDNNYYAKLISWKYCTEWRCQGTLSDPTLYIIIAVVIVIGAVSAVGVFYYLRKKKIRENVINE